MRIRNLVVLAITIILGALSAAAQDRDGSLTFTDHSNRSITINRFGAVVSFKNGDGKQTAPANIYRVCPCGEQAGCIESATMPDDKTSSKFNVEFPKKGTTLEKEQTLVVTSTFRRGDLTVMRRINWEAGSNAVKIDEVISSSKPLCPAILEDKPALRSLEMKMCPRPPIPGYICPPYDTVVNPDAMRTMTLATLLNF